MHPHTLIRDRLRQEMTKRSLTAVELARSAGVKNSFIYDILNGKSTNPSSVTLAMVAESLGLSLSYLVGAGEPPHTSESRAATAADIFAVLPLEANSTKMRDKKNTPPIYFRQSWVRDHLSVNPAHLRTLTVTGESMAPTLCNGDMLLVNTGSIQPSPPGIFVLSDGLSLAARRLELGSAARRPVLRIISDNPQYGTHERRLSDVRIMGRVVWFARTL